MSLWDFRSKGPLERLAYAIFDRVNLILEKLEAMGTQQDRVEADITEILNDVSGVETEIGQLKTQLDQAIAAQAAGDDADFQPIADQLDSIHQRLQALQPSTDSTGTGSTDAGSAGAGGADSGSTGSGGTDAGTDGAGAGGAPASTGDGQA